MEFSTDKSEATNLRKKKKNTQLTYLMICSSDVLLDITLQEKDLGMITGSSIKNISVFSSSPKNLLCMNLRAIWRGMENRKM